jgi:enamine deaminase RidA (YjgF/YER057c/UK114 family)
MKLIDSPELPAPAGHYSQAVAAGGLVFVSGILPALSDVAPSAPFTDQCASVFAQCEKVLRAAGCGFGDVVQCTAYIADVAY